MEMIVRLEDFIKTEIHPLQTNIAPENGSLKRGEKNLLGKPIIFRGPVMLFFFLVFGILKLPTHFLKLILRLCRMSFGAYASDLRHLRVGWEDTIFVEAGGW